MSSQFKHFLTTRFNLAFEEWSKDKNHNQVRTDDWLQKRIQLFEKYCLPSISKQTNQDFDWIILFDVSSPDFLKSRIKEWQKLCPRIHPLFTRAKTYLIDLKEIISVKNDNREFVITTRIDNDDVFQLDAIAEIQKAFLPKNVVIDFPFGYFLDVKGRKMTEQDYPNNPFISVIEKMDSMETVWSRRHADWIEFPRTQTMLFPMWIQVIHNSNKVNTFRHGRYVSLSELKLFGINEISNGFGFLTRTIFNCSIRLIQYLKRVKRKLR
jgi:hypothetical protein